MGVHLITGSDESLRGDAVGDLVHRLVGDGDRTLMVDDFDGEYEVRALVDAAQTPPFLTDRRVVVGRSIGQFNAEQLSGLLAYLADPLDTTELVLVGGGGAISKPLSDAVKKAGGHTIATGAPQPKQARAWVEEQIAVAGVQLDREAVTAVVGWLGEEAARLRGLLEVLTSTFGTGTRIRLADVEPYLASKGSVPPWDLTDAIDRGDTTLALSLLGRMMGLGERHPLQIMAILQGHYARILRLDGADVRTEAAAQELLGVKSAFQAKKAMDQSRRLGSTGIRRAMALLAQADLDLRGEKDWPEALVMEVLIARLSRLGAPVRR